MNDPEHLDARLNDLQERHDLVGMSVVAIRNKQVCYTQGFGLADISRGIPVTDATLYRVASVSKSITATAVMILHDRGLLHLDDDISDHLAYRVRNPRYPGTPITVRMLLSHTSSLTDGPSYDEFLFDSCHADPPPELADLLATNKGYEAGNLFSNHAPGSCFEYANLNYGILGTLVEVIANARFDLFCKTHIFLPLGMDATFNIQDLANIDTVATLYRKEAGVWTPQMDDFRGVRPSARDLSRYRPGANALVFAPHGGLRASANDLATFLLMHLNEGTHRNVSILRPETAKLMRRPSAETDHQWGLGFRLTNACPRKDIDSPAISLAGHSGEAYGLLSSMYFDADGGFGIVFIANGCGTGFHSQDHSSSYSLEDDVFRHVWDFFNGS